MLMKRGYDMSKLESTIDLLLTGELMLPEYHDHPLRGNLAVIVNAMLAGKEIGY